MSAINVPLCAEESYVDYMQMLSETICFWSPNSPIVDNDPQVLKACLRIGYKCPSVQRCECTPATAIIGRHAGQMPFNTAKLPTSNVRDGVCVTMANLL